MNRASGGEEKSPIFWTQTLTPTVNRPVSNTAVESLLTNNVTPLPANSDLYKVALALSQSSALMNKSGAAYDAAAKSWLNGMGYSANQQQQIIKLSLEIAFNNLSSRRLLNDGIADIINRTLTNRNWRHVAPYSGCVD